MKYQKLSKATKRVIQGGAIPSVRGKVKHYEPKKRNNCRRGEREWSTSQHGGNNHLRVELRHDSINERKAGLDLI